MRAVLLRYAAVIGIGLAVLGGILYYASNVDGRPPFVEAVRVTLHASDDDRLALTTAGIEVEFSEAVRAPTAEAAFRIEPAVAGEFSWSGTILRFTPEERLPLETDFTVQVRAGVEDEVGNRSEEASDAFEFRTVGRPGVATTEPMDGATDVALDSPIVITFNTIMDTASVEDALSISPVLAHDLSWNAEALTIVPEARLREGTQYVVTIGTEALDSAGIPLAEPYEFSFETSAAPVEVTGVMPADGLEGVAVRSPIAIFFDRELDPDAELDGLFSIDPEVPGSLDVIALPGAAGLAEPARRVLRFEPSGALAPSTTYRITLAAGVTAADGSRLGEAFAWSFTTGAPLGTLSNQVVFLSDRSGVSNLWAMNPDGSGQRQVSAELSPITDYAVAPDGRRVVLADGATLILISAEGSGRSLLTARGDLEFDPAWAPDGTRFAFGRGDLASGAGEGLWTRAADGGDERRIEIPAAEPSPVSPSPTPDGSAGEPPARAAILRAPRYAPDGSAIAWADASGGIGILDLDEGDVRRSSLYAVAPPAWLADSEALIATVLFRADPVAYAAGLGLPPLAPAAPLLDEGQVARTALARVDRGSGRATDLGLPPGAHHPVPSVDRLLYVVDGRAYLADDPRAPDPGRDLLPDELVEVETATFGVEPRSIVLGLDRGGGGIWLLDALTGRVDRLIDDGRLPRWLP